MGMQHLDMPHLRGREEPAEEAESDERMKGITLAKGRPAKWRGSGMSKLESAEGKGKVIDKDESGRTDLINGGDELETVDSMDRGDSNEPSHAKAKRTRRQLKMIPRRESRRVRGC